jgi:hypothetical protein
MPRPQGRQAGEPVPRETTGQAGKPAPRSGLALPEVVRAVIGPAALVTAAVLQGVRVTGPVTVALVHPRPPVATSLADVLAALALTTLALYAAGAASGCRPPVSRFLVPVAAAQLPMALVAILVGRTMLGRTVTEAVGRHGEELLKKPGLLIQPVGLQAALAFVLTILAVGILFLGYHRATRTKGWRLYVGFAGGLIAAEVLCRVWSWFAA